MGIWAELCWLTMGGVELGWSYILDKSLLFFVIKKKSAKGYGKLLIY